jgi:peptidyl-prolyl cis-trans isomerase B (cyclophilin B)
MKLNWRAGFLIAALFLAGCDHHKTADQASRSAPAPRGDSELTGARPQPIDSMKTYPRATLVALPGHAPALTPSTARSAAAPVSNPPAETVASSTPALSENPAPSPTPAPETVPAPSADAMSSPTAEANTPAAAPDASPTTPPASLSADATSASPGSLGASMPAPATETSATEASSAPDHSEVAVIQTYLGKIVIELDDFAAPKTCKNFRQLVNDGFYNNTVFHRVIPNFIIQGGDPKSKSVATDRNTYGLGSPGYTLPAEIALKHDRGAVAMARLPDDLNPQRESNGSQFYICLVACPSLDDQYTVFGHVIQGLDIAEKIANQPRDARDNPLKRVEMTVNIEPKDQALANSTGTGP